MSEPSSSRRHAGLRRTLRTGASRGRRWRGRRRRRPHPGDRTTRAVDDELARGHAGHARRVPPAREAHGSRLQPRLLVLLLPLQGDALPGLTLPDGRGPPRDVPPPADRGPLALAGRDDRLAGRRADADGARLLPPLGRADRASSRTGP